MKTHLIALSALLVATVGCRTSQSRDSNVMSEVEITGNEFVAIQHEGNYRLQEALNTEVVNTTPTNETFGKHIGFQIWSDVEGDKKIHCDIYQLSIILNPKCKVKLGTIQNGSAESLYNSLKTKEVNAEDYTNTNELGYLVAIKQLDLVDHELKCERRRYSIMNKFICSIHKKGEGSLKPTRPGVENLDRANSKTLYEVLEAKTVKTPHAPAGQIDFKNWNDAEGETRVHCENYAESLSTYQACSIALGKLDGVSGEAFYKALKKDETQTDDATYYSNSNVYGYLAATKQIDLGTVKINCERRRLSIMNKFICEIEKAGK
ncbi:MAG: hypothetical protein AB7T49_19085 [Oligoflexales bacterium]